MKKKLIFLLFYINIYYLMENIFVLELENGKFFIGKTKYQNIPQNINLKWVKENKILKVKEFYSSDDIFEENNVTKSYMLKYGIDNVRGGSYKNYELNDIEKIMLKNELQAVYKNDLDYYNDLLTISSIKKEIKQLKNICEKYYNIQEKLRYVDINYLSKIYFKSQITPNIYNNYVNFVTKNCNVQLVNNKLSGTKTNIKMCDDILDSINNNINFIYNSLFPNSFLLKNNTTNGLKIKIKEIYIYNIKINKQMQNILKTPQRNFSSINEIYQTINLLLEKQIMLEEVNDEEDTFLDEEDTILDEEQDDETTITEEDGFINDSVDVDNLTFVDENDENDETEKSISSLLNRSYMLNKN